MFVMSDDTFSDKELRSDFSHGIRLFKILNALIIYYLSHTNTISLNFYRKCS